MRKNLLALSFSLLILSSINLTLAHPHNRANTQKKKASTLFDSSPIPVVHGSKKDGLPDNLKVRGTITVVSFALAHCGIIAFAGTLKIKLLNKIDGYPHEEVFVVVSCFLDRDNESKYLNKIVSLEVGKLYSKKEGLCYFEVATNTIDSKGVPFYCAAIGQDRILKVIEKENAQ